MLARITAPDLATDVQGAEQLIVRHKENKTEIDARQDDFSKFYKTGQYHVYFCTLYFVEIFLTKQCKFKL